MKRKDELGLIIFDGAPVVSSRDIAKVFEKEHKDVLETIRNSIDTLSKENLTAEFSAVNIIESSYNTRGKKYPEYLLTKDGFTFITMGFGGIKAAKFKIAYINCFNEMESFIKSRSLAKIEYPELTDAIKLAHGDNAKFYHYSNEADMINKIVLGKRAREFRKEHGLDKDEPIRDHISSFELDMIQRLQKLDVGLVTLYPDSEYRKQILEKYYIALKNNAVGRIAG